MKTLVIVCFATAFAGQAWAAGCGASAVDKNGKSLSGAAKASFMSKCERDAKATCEKTAADKKLSGAAKSSFVGKCVKDAA